MQFAALLWSAGHDFGVPFMHRAPYSWLMALPGYDAVRVPARFAMLAALCLSVAAALAFVRLTSRARWPSRATLAGFAIAGILIDSWISETPLPRLPGRLKALESQSATPVLSCRSAKLGDDVAAMYRGMHHGRAVVNGYSGFFPASYDASKRGLAMGDPQMFDAIAAWGPVTVAVDRNRDTGGRWVSQLASRPETVDLGEEANWKFFPLKAGSLPTCAARPSDRLEIHSLSANVNSEANRPGTGRKFDDTMGQRSTARWGNRGRRSWLPRTIRAVTMTITGHLSDFSPECSSSKRPTMGKSGPNSGKGRRAFLRLLVPSATCDRLRSRFHFHRCRHDCCGCDSSATIRCSIGRSLSWKFLGSDRGRVMTVQNSVVL